MASKSSAAAVDQRRAFQAGCCRTRGASPATPQWRPVLRKLGCEVCGKLAGWWLQGDVPIPRTPADILASVKGCCCRGRKVR